MLRFKTWILAIISGLWIAGLGALASDGPAHDLKDLHPRMFEMVLCDLSDTAQPVVTEFNLDAIRKNRNQFDFDEIRSRQGWQETSHRDGQGFHRIRMLPSEGPNQIIEYQTNSGGTLTTTAVIEFSIENRTLKIDGAPVSTRVLKITSVSK